MNQACKGRVLTPSHQLLVRSSPPADPDSILLVPDYEYHAPGKLVCTLPRDFVGSTDVFRDIKLKVSMSSN